MEEKKKIMLAHGGGGRLMADLINRTIVPKFGEGQSVQLTDSAVLDMPAGKLCFTTDSFVVKPLFFNGGDIGKLAVCGTVNDLAVAGAKPVALSLSLILEEGLELEVLERILESIGRTAKNANVPIVTGDTKVVEKGSADSIFINTSGVGVRLDKADPSFARIEPGDAILINGTLGEHGMTIMSQREGLKFQTPLASDCACLHDLTGILYEELGSSVKFMRDPTRGGIAATLNEIAQSARVAVELQEACLPMDKTVQTAADMLGFDLLNIANEGKVLAVVAREDADKALTLWKNHPLGQKAAIIGTITEAADGPLVELVTKIGGRRMVQTPYGRELPRIC
ncbi:MAG: hydrogenase expression/formation protein HypE [Planctomycetales bacterium]|nr:hydrogenase expression/formation protein HypE [Planctomycetales bacterium]